MERAQVWLAAWTATAQCINAKSLDCTRFADQCLQAFDERFPAEIPVMFAHEFCAHDPHSGEDNESKIWLVQRKLTDINEAEWLSPVRAFQAEAEADEFAAMLNDAVASAHDPRESEAARLDPGFVTLLEPCDKLAYEVIPIPAGRAESTSPNP